VALNVTVYSDSAMNDACIDMHQLQNKSGKTASNKESKGCPFKDKQMSKKFRDHALVQRTFHPRLSSNKICQAQVQDIEDLASLGRKLQSCAYYGTREAAKVAEVGLV
jgi:hypothetical protein